MSDNQGVELLPCPHCGNARISLFAVRDGYEARCHCGAGVEAFNPDSQQKATEQWNTRTTPASAGVLVEAQFDATEIASQLLACVERHTFYTKEHLRDELHGAFKHVLLAARQALSATATPASDGVLRQALESLQLADATLRGANMDRAFVEKAVTAAITRLSETQFITNDTDTLELLHVMLSTYAGRADQAGEAFKIVDAALSATPTPDRFGEGYRAGVDASAKVVAEHGETWGLSYRSMTDTLEGAIRALQPDAGEGV